MKEAPGSGSHDGPGRASLPTLARVTGRLRGGGGDPQAESEGVASSGTTPLGDHQTRQGTAWLPDPKDPSKPVPALSGVWL